MSDEDQPTSVASEHARKLYYTAHPLGNEFHVSATVHQTEVVEHKEICQDGFLVQPNRFEQNGDRHLTTTVNTEVQDVFWIKLKVHP